MHRQSSNPAPAYQLPIPFINPSHHNPHPPHPRTTTKRKSRENTKTFPRHRKANWYFLFPCTRTCEIFYISFLNSDAIYFSLGIATHRKLKKVEQNSKAKQKKQKVVFGYFAPGYIIQPLYCTVTQGDKKTNYLGGPIGPGYPEFVE
jgi:hypothetical protein